MTRTIDVLRVATDAAYAAALSPEDWYTVAESPQWAQMLAEQRELVQSTLDTHGHMLPGFAQQVAPPTAPEVLRCTRARCAARIHTRGSRASTPARPSSFQGSTLSSTAATCPIFIKM
jgi:hypothetical protein